MSSERPIAAPAISVESKAKSPDFSLIRTSSKTEMLARLAQFDDAQELNVDDISNGISDHERRLFRTTVGKFREFWVKSSDPRGVSRYVVFPVSQLMKEGEEKADVNRKMIKDLEELGVDSDIFSGFHGRDGRGYQGEAVFEFSPADILKFAGIIEKYLAEKK